MTDTARLAGMIPSGRENAITRAELACRMGLNDRQMRKVVEDARAEGVIILNRQDGGGYYQTDDLDDMMRQYRQDTARALAILKRRKPLRDKLKAAGRKV